MYSVSVQLIHASNIKHGLESALKRPRGCADGAWGTARCCTTIGVTVLLEDILSTNVGRDLRSVYIMTNGDTRWLAQLKFALRRVHTWNTIATSRDLNLTWEQKFVSQSMDMMVGERAQVYIGNGVSSSFCNAVASPEPVLEFSSQACHPMSQCCVWRKGSLQTVPGCGRCNHLSVKIVSWRFTATAPQLVYVSSDTALRYPT